MTKFITIFLWVLSVILAWGMSENDQFSHLSSVSDYILIASAFLLVISPPIYWIFTFSETLEKPPASEEEIQLPQAEIFIDNIIAQQNAKNLSPFIRKKSEREIDKIFAKVERLSGSNKEKEELQNTKKQIQVKILCLLNDQLFAIEKLQEEALMMIEMSEYLRDSEKLLLLHNIKSYITEKKNDLTE